MGRSVPVARAGVELCAVWTITLSSPQDRD